MSCLTATQLVEFGKADGSAYSSTVWLPSPASLLPLLKNSSLRSLLVRLPNHLNQQLATAPPKKYLSDRGDAGSQRYSTPQTKYHWRHKGLVQVATLLLPEVLLVVCLLAQSLEPAVRVVISESESLLVL